MLNASFSATGAGKSSILNAILDSVSSFDLFSVDFTDIVVDNIVPTSGMRGMYDICNFQYMPIFCAPY